MSSCHNIVLVPHVVLPPSSPSIDVREEFHTDGTKTVHDLRRLYKDGRGSYDEVLANLKVATKYFKNIVVHSVIDSKSIPNIHALLSELRAHGLDEDKISVDFAPESPSQTTVATGGME